MISELEYIDWITGRPEQAAHDLGSSDLRWEGGGPLDPAVLGGFPAPPAGRTFRELVADVYDVTPEQVLATAGGTHANVLTFLAALDGTGRGVLVERPGYEPLRATPTALGAEVRRFERPAADDYRLDPKAVTAAIGSDTALVVVTNRHNPSGRLVNRETLAAVAGAVADRGARLLVDEVYAPFGDRQGARAFGGPTAAGLPGAVVTSSLTKFYGLGGLRVGWAIADEAMVERLRTALRHVPAVADPSLELGRTAVAAAEQLSSRARSRIVANADRLRSFVKDRADLSGSVYDGVSFGFLRHARADGDAVAEAAWEHGVLVVPGRFFDDESRFRVSLAGEPTAMADGLAALGRALDTR